MYSTACQDQGRAGCSTSGLRNNGCSFKMSLWSRQELLEAALEEFHSGKGKKSIRGLAKKYDIPPSTLHDHVRQKVSKCGAGRQLGHSIYGYGKFKWELLELS